MTALTNDRKVAEVWSCLAPVTDPELDESVTELGFVTAVTVDEGDGVTIGFRLPTYWCAANFAFLMADDMRRAVSALPWVASASVELKDHMYAEEINRGMAGGRSFQDTFAGEAEAELDEVRETFRRKAFQRRQEGVIRELLGRGYSPDQLIAMTLAALERLPIDDECRRLVARYLEMRRGWGGDDADAGAPAFVTADGDALEARTFNVYLLELRRVRLNVELNGALCRGLLKARYRDETAEDGEPTLLDFALGRVG